MKPGDAVILLAALTGAAIIATAVVLLAIAGLI